MKIFGDNVWIMSNIYSEYVPNRPIQLSGPTLQLLVHMLRLDAAANKKPPPMPATIIHTAKQIFLHCDSKIVHELLHFHLPSREIPWNNKLFIHSNTKYSQHGSSQSSQHNMKASPIVSQSFYHPRVELDCVSKVCDKKHIWFRNKIPRNTITCGGEALALPSTLKLY